MDDVALVTDSGVLGWARSSLSSWEPRAPSTLMEMVRISILPEELAQLGNDKIRLEVNEPLLFCARGGPSLRLWSPEHIRRAHLPDVWALKESYLDAFVCLIPLQAHLPQWSVHCVYH
jgi:hypothetical protein